MGVSAGKGEWEVREVEKCAKVLKNVQWKWLKSVQNREHTKEVHETAVSFSGAGQLCQFPQGHLVGCVCSVDGIIVFLHNSIRHVKSSPPQAAKPRICFQYECKTEQKQCGTERQVTNRLG